MFRERHAELRDVIIYEECRELSGQTRRIQVRKIGTFLCGIMVAALLTGCGDEVPDLTQEETDLISEYAVGVVLKHDKYYSGRLVDISAYEEVEEETPEDISEEIPEEELEQNNTASNTEVVDASQDEDVIMTIEDYYDIDGIKFEYLGYELTRSYPSAADGEDLFFSMDATEGEQLLVIKFLATNITSSDINLNMINEGARFRISVNGESGQRTLMTMLLNDMQSYSKIMPPGYSEELVSVVEIPQSVPVENIDFIMTGSGENVTLKLE